MGVDSKYYVNIAGDYLGGFSAGNSAIPEGAIEVAAPPEHGWQKYDAVAQTWLALTEEQLALIG